MPYALALRVAHLWPVWPALLKLRDWRKDAVWEAQLLRHVQHVLASEPTPVAITPTTPLCRSIGRGAPPKPIQPQN